MEQDASRSLVTPAASRDAPGIASLARARGRGRLVFAHDADTTALADLNQEGSLRICLPRRERGALFAAVMVNTAGGLTGGDDFALEVSWPPGSRATVTTQAAERVYRALRALGPATVSTKLEVGAGAVAEWLPQETILFDRSALDRRLEVSLAFGAWFLGIESLVFGREAMGESVSEGSLRDTIDVRRGGQRLLLDRLRLDGPVANLLARPAVAAGARAVATIVHVASDAEHKIGVVRERASALPGVEVGASTWDGMLVARVLAPGGAALRAATIELLAPLRDGRPLPRVWSC